MDPNVSTPTSIGPGPVRNNRFATRHLDFDIDRLHARRHNEDFHDSVKEGLVLLATGSVLLAGGGYLLTFTSVWVMVLGGVLGILGLGYGVLSVLGAFTPRSKPIGLLERGVLNPAIVCAAQGGHIWLLTLSDIAVDDGEVWAIFATKVKSLPGHSNTVGERIPVTCSFSDIDGNQFKTIYVSPIAWGTASAEVLNDAVEGIDEIEWQALQALCARFVHDDTLACCTGKCVHVLTDQEAKALGLKP